MLECDGHTSNHYNSYHRYCSMDQIMQTKPYLAGFTKIQMVFYFLELHQEGKYSSFYITVYLWNNFYLPEGKTFEQLYREVCGVISEFYKPENAHKEKNFDRELDLASKRKVFLYEHVENCFVNLPHAYLKYAEPRTLTLEVKPTQQKVGKIKEVVPTGQKSFNFFNDQLEDTDQPENITLETQTLEEEPELEEQVVKQEEFLSPLMQDIKNANILQSKEIYYWPSSLEELGKLLKPNESIIIKKIEDNTFIVSRTMEA
jgi:hypothetical protein